MKLYLLLPLAFTLGCNAVKTSNQPSHADQLINDVKILSSDKYEGRKTGTKGAELARAYIAKRFKEIGLRSYTSCSGYQQSFSFSGIDDPKINGKNMIGYIKGTTSKVIVISAHYDHLGIINGKIYNGADDNASGVAGLLKIATHYARNKPMYTMIFAAFDAEEFGRKGSEHFVNHPPVDIKKIKLNLNLDMISHNDKGELYAAGTYKYPQLKSYIATTNPDLKILFGHDNSKLATDDWTNQSDQAAFNAVNIPFIYFGVEDHKDYHKASDTFENINQTFFINAANGILEITDNFDKERTVEKVFQDRLQSRKR
ncbi:Zn-dependent M28 family amino/carboxypeptidase [Pedobacter cryoconitis]|uniref:Zn-dependent M28 family amino/carboxypeptidase n=1 Tax=Pedobacter cryoconitis TaxID=188932 RepID=A0A7W9E1C0_9SPHI|nr:M28 family peptidase [Pedobacter cryoconitis]MBB5637495.1 Zn-dependent M28 family amino/carboxypeptidase [Pedobacter cryoconitis]MBB6269922.1 Zn-dependent M28 family amino/carboxypeptidase [Pedobacter cryoconitis]